MSVRTEPRELSERLHGALNLSADQLQQQGIKLQEPAGTAGAYQGEQMMMQPQTATSAGAVALPGNEHALAEANTFNTSHPEYPLNRTVSVTIRASLNDLCLRKTASVWAPNSDAVKSILQQRKYTDLAGSAENQARRIRKKTHDPSLCIAHAHRPRFAFLTGRPEVDCPAQADAVGAEVVLPDGARPVDHGRRRLDLLGHGRFVLCDRDAECGHSHVAAAAGGRHLARCAVANSTLS